MIVECDVLAILVKSYDKEDFKIYLLKVWKDLCYDHTKYFSFREWRYKACSRIID